MDLFFIILKLKSSSGPGSPSAFCLRLKSPDGFFNFSLDYSHLLVLSAFFFETEFSWRSFDF